MVRFVLEETAPEQPGVPLAWKGGALSLTILLFSVLKQSSANLVAPCTSHSHTQLLSILPRKPLSKTKGPGRWGRGVRVRDKSGRWHDWGSAPAFRGSERVVNCFLPTPSRTPLRLGSASRSRVPRESGRSRARSLPDAALKREGTQATPGQSPRDHRSARPSWKRLGVATHCDGSGPSGPP